MWYDYECLECNYVIKDVKVKLADLEFHVVICPKCGGDTARKIGNKGGFRLKGSCWSRDGYSYYVGEDSRWSDDTGLNGVNRDEV